MTDKEKQEQGQPQTTDDRESTTTDDKGGAPAGAKNTDTPESIPYDRFKEVNDRNKQLAARLDELERERKEREAETERERQKQLRDQEKYKELAEELEQKLEDVQPRLAETQARLQKLEEILEAHATAQLELVPEVYHPVINKLPVEERLEWVTENRDALAPKSDDKPSGVPATPRGRGRGEISDEERRKLAAPTF